MSNLTMPDNQHLDDLWRRIDTASERSERLRRRAHRAGVLALGAGLVALLTAGAIALVAPPPPTPLSQDERERIYVENVEASWQGVLEQYPDAVRPEVELIRYIDGEELLPTLAQCLREEGFAARMEDDGSVSSFAGIGQDDDYEIASFVCRARYPVDPDQTQPLNDAEIEFVYRYWSEQTAACLRGYGVDVGEVPTLTEFRASYGTAEHWSPYAAMYQDDAWDWERIATVEKACPPRPPGLR